MNYRVLIGLIVFPLLFLSGCTQQPQKEEGNEHISTTEKVEDMDPVVEKKEESLQNRETESESPQDTPPKKHPPKPLLPLTEVEWIELEHDFGEVTEGELVSHVYKFKNTGDKDLYILNVRPSCGCTQPEYSEDAIPPGEIGEIKAIYDSTKRKGEQKKTVVVILNTEKRVYSFTFEAMVVEGSE